MAEGCIHDHIHSVGAKPPTRALFACVALTLSFALVEWGAGVYAGSLALISDAGHMALDAFVLLLAALAAALGARAPTARHSFGLAKAESVAGLFGAALMLALICWVVVSAARRFGAPEPVAAEAVMEVALIGLLVNGAVGWVLIKATPTLSVKAALLHVAGDALGSLAALASGALIAWKGWQWADPALSLLISALLLRASWSLLRQSARELLDAVPDSIDLGQAREALGGIEGVSSVLDLHIWPLSASEPALSAHLRIEPGRECQPVLAAAQSMLHQRFGIRHCTIQPHEGEVLDPFWERCGASEPGRPHAHPHGHGHAHPSAGPGSEA